MENWLNESWHSREKRASELGDPFCRPYSSASCGLVQMASIIVPLLPGGRSTQAPAVIDPYGIVIFGDGVGLGDEGLGVDGLGLGDDGLGDDGLGIGLMVPGRPEKIR